MIMKIKIMMALMMTMKIIIVTIIAIMMIKTITIAVVIINTPFQPGNFSTGSTTAVMSF